MCGRFKSHSALEIITRVSQIDSVPFDVKPKMRGMRNENPLIPTFSKGNVMARCKLIYPLLEYPASALA